MSRQPLTSPDVQGKSLLVVLLLVTVLFGVVLWPLSGAVSWAVFIAIVFSSLQERTARAYGGRRGWAAFSTLLVIVVSVLLPTALLGVSIVQEAAAFYTRVRSGDVELGSYFQHALDALPGWMRALLGRSGLEDLAAIEHRVLETIARSSQALTARAFSITQNTVDFVLNLFVMLYLLFFLLRDGPQLAAAAQRVLPLRPDITQRLLREFAVVVRATVKGNVLIALVQGLLGGLSFWVLGIQGAVLWGAVMAVLSLLPAIGAALVWGPVVLYLFATGQLWQAAALLAWSAGVIGLVDNALRPVLVGKDTRLPDYLVLIATLGGLSAFGPNGFVIGPAIAAVFIAAWEIFAEVRAEQRAQERHEA